VHHWNLPHAGNHNTFFFIKKQLQMDERARERDWADLARVLKKTKIK
jgi:hypothetical protein